MVDEDMIKSNVIETEELKNLILVWLHEKEKFEKEEKVKLDR